MENKESKKQMQMRKNIRKICNNEELKTKKFIKEYFIITTGALIMAIGVSLFLLPNELSTGGFSGLGTIAYYVLKFPLGATTLVLNIPLLLIAYFRISKELFLKSIYGTIALSFFIDILDRLQPIIHDRFLGCIYGGILIGVGTAIILKVNGSTGGSDLLSYVIKSFKPQYKSGTLILIIDVIIIALNVFVFKAIDIGLYSAIAIFLMSKMIDLIFEGINFTKVLLIISPEYKKIAETIGKNIDRGSTALYSKGMYTNEDKMTLLCVGSRNEAYNIQYIAKQIDKNAFIIIMNAREVLGKGFKKQL